MRFITVLALSACVAHTAPIIAPPAVLPPIQSEDAQTGPLLLRDGVVYVADEDPPSVRAFDAIALRELWSVPLESAPAHIAAHGGRVFVSLRGPS